MAGSESGIRWGRAVLGGLLIELALMAVTVPVFALMADPSPALDMLIPPASLVAALLVGIWVGGPAPRPVASGLVAGIAAVAIYLALTLAGYAMAPDQMDVDQSLGLPYLASHALKIVGAGAGGYWAGKRRSEGR